MEQFLGRIRNLHMARQRERRPDAAVGLSLAIIFAVLAAVLLTIPH